jgi:hypothetical protein
MFDKVKFGRLLPAQLKDLAKAEAKAITTRWDVPSGPDVPEDLRDIVGRYFRTAPDALGHQGKIAGRMLAEDLVQGSFSPAIPVLFALVPVLAMLMVYTHTNVLGLVFGALMVANLFFIATATERKMWALAAAIFGVLLPLASGSLQHTGSAALGAMVPGVSVGFVSVGAVMASISMVVILTFLMAGLRATRVAIGVMFGLMVIMGLSELVWDWAKPAVLAIPGCLLPIAWSTYEDWVRSKRLAMQDLMSTFESGAKPLNHIEARKQQAEKAAKDTSPLITYGTSMGKLTSLWDGFAPDAGLPMRQSVFDLATHMMILGSTGRGKTSSLLMPIIEAYLRGDGGGLLVMDGKGSLAAVFRKLKNYLLLDPSLVTVGLYENLNALGVARTLKEIFVRDDALGGDDAIWIDSAYIMALHSAVLLEAMVKYSRGEPESGWRWTMSDHFRLTTIGMRGTTDDATEMDGILSWIGSKTKGTDDHMLKAAIQYYKSELPGMPANTAGSIKAQLNSWMSPALSNPEILKWAMAEKGEQVEDALHGRPVGINLPFTRFAQAGTIATAFIKNRFFSAIRERADADPKTGGWRGRDESATNVLVVMDEAQLLLGDADQEIAPIGRSLGCWMVICSQTIESLQATSKNAAQIEAFLDAFQSVISLSSSAGTVKWLQNRVGTSWQPQFGMKGVGIDFVGSAANALDSSLFHRSHPQHKWFKSMLRWGAGGFADVNPAQVDIGDVEGMLKFRLRTTAGMEAWKEVDLINLADFKSLTAQQGVALAVLTRGGVPRRDFIRLDRYMDSLPDDMCDPNYKEVYSDDALAQMAAENPDLPLTTANTQPERELATEEA